MELEKDNDKGLKKMWFYTSDQHYGHKNVIKYCNRPFGSVEEMDETMIERHNSKIQSHDDVVFLGDFSFHRDVSITLGILKRLNGRKHWIKGNHDHKETVKKCGHLFDWVNQYFEQKIKDPDAMNSEQRIILCHYPMVSWNSMSRGAWHLHGHTHNSLSGLVMQYGNKQIPYYSNKVLDMGVDVHNFYPLSYEEIKEIMNERVENTIDHHDAGH